MTMTGLVLGYSVVAAIAYLLIGASRTLVSALRLGARREEAIDNHDALSVSRFTMPVSLIVPVSGRMTTGDAADAASAVDATAPLLLSPLLALNYPEFEVIVVAEDLPELVWQSL